VAQPELTPKQCFDDLIVWYINGALEPEDRQWVEGYLRDHPELRHELAWHEQLKRANDIQDLDIPKNVGLRGLLEQVNAERAKQQPSTLMERIAQFFSGPILRPAFAAAAAVVLAQAIALGLLVKAVYDRDRIITDFSTTRAVPGQLPSDKPTLQVTFKSSATEQQIRLLLVSVQATIIAGPTQLGDYTVAVSREGFNDAKVKLEASAIVESVSPGRPSS
jgi:hypothetical protein